MVAILAQTSRFLRVVAWATLVTQILIVATGGAVRLTGSGLGCPTWPLCTDASLVATAEMGIHGAIEFGNRVLSVIVGIVALVLVASTARTRPRRYLFAPSVAILGLTAVQVVVGGISVLLGLHPSVVGVHFIISVVLVVLATVVVYRAYHSGGGRRLVPRWLVVIAYVTAFAAAVTIVVGVLTTGSGPHAGDDASARNGLDPQLLQHLHAWPAYVTAILTLVFVAGALRANRATATFALLLLTIETVQVAVGLAQSRVGLPPLLVGIHMVLACVLAAAMTATILSLRGARPESADEAAGQARPQETPASNT